MKSTSEPVILVSACLLGVNCRYNGASRKDDRVIEYVKGKRFAPVCPESLTGLPVPRLAAEFDGEDGSGVRNGRSRVVLRDGTDVTREFIKGAVESIKLARLLGATEAVLKDRSPSCGVYEVYNNGEVIGGVGCFTAFLLLEGVKVKSEKDV
jgi:uncharacterized protein YbbK (DUF523 family)